MYGQARRKFSIFLRTTNPAAGFHRADPDAKARDILRIEMPDNILQPVMPASRAGESQAQSPRRQRDIVQQDPDILRRDLIEPRDHPHRFAGEVHEGHRADEQHLLTTNIAFPVDGAIIPLRDRDIVPFRQPLDDLEADIMPCSRVLRARIAQPYNQFHSTIVPFSHLLPQGGEMGQLARDNPAAFHQRETKTIALSGNTSL